MDKQEIRDKILAAINGIIKDEPEAAQTNLHDVLAAKMRDRISPESTMEVDDTSLEQDLDDDDTSSDDDKPQE